MTVVRDTSTSHDVTADAGFRAYFQMVHNALATVGLVNTADTGQINLATVTAPAINVFAGYEIWRFNDTDQSNNPIYFKIEYGKGSVTSQPKWRVTCGTGSDGAGTITNAGGAIAGTPSTPAGTPEFHCCAIDGCLVMCSVEAPTSNISAASWVMLERIRDENGNVISAGGSQGYILAVGGSGSANQRKGGTNTNSISAQNMGVPSGPLPDGRKRTALHALGDNNPCIGMALFKDTAVVAGDVGTLQVYGTNHTYRVLTAAAQASQFGGFMFGTATVNCVAAILSE